MADDHFDLIIIGAGPGGYVAAIRAAQLGMKTAVVEAADLGGICLNWGCIPTKALLRSADIYREMQHAAAYGLSAACVGFDLAAIVQRSRKVAAQLNRGVGYLLKKNEVTVIEGWGQLAGGAPGARRVTVARDGAIVGTVSAKRVILATGARARALPGLEADGDRVWSYRHALQPPAMPKSLLVIGSGAIGIEFASFFRTLGADVTVVEVMDRVLPVEDAEISALAAKAFKKQGMTLLTGATVTAVQRGADSVTVTVTVTQGGASKEIVVERVISAVGIVGNVEDLGLEATQIRVEKTHIHVDSWSETDEPGVYAIGDVAGPPWLAHKAEHEGVICVEKIADVAGVHPLDSLRIPSCTYCHPQIASIGLTEQAAKDAGYAVKVGRFPFSGNGKAIALGESEGLVKTVFDASSGELLGAHMIGVEVTELIQGFSVARALEGTEAELMHTVFPHPTLSEMMHESVLDAFGRAIHI